MNTRIYNRLLVTLILFFSTISLSTAVAQINDTDYGVMADIPFAFTAGNTKLPAGEYTIVDNPDFSQSMELHNTDGSVNMLLVVDDHAGSMKQLAPELVFDRIGNKEFLRDVQTQDSDYQFAMSKVEKSLVKSNQKIESHRIASVSLNSRTQS